MSARATHAEATAARWARVLAATVDAPVRVAYLKTELAAAEPSDAARALEVTLARAELAHGPELGVALALCVLLADEGGARLAAWLRAAAIADGLEAVARFFGRYEPAPEHAGEPAPEPGERKLPERAGVRTLTLGERRAIARRPTRAAMPALLRDPHPWVIRNLLGASTVTEDDVVRLASKRPTYADVLTEVARSPKWLTRPRVRAALVLNPWMPADVGVPIVTLLAHAELESLVETESALASLRARAREVLALRRLAR